MYPGAVVSPLLDRVCSLCALTERLRCPLRWERRGGGEGERGGGRAGGPPARHARERSTSDRSVEERVLDEEAAGFLAVLVGCTDVPSVAVGGVWVGFDLLCCDFFFFFWRPRCGVKAVSSYLVVLSRALGGAFQRSPEHLFWFSTCSSVSLSRRVWLCPPRNGRPAVCLSGNRRTTVDFSFGVRDQWKVAMVECSHALSFPRVSPGAFRCAAGVSPA